MSYNGYVAQLKNVRKHPNADALLLGEVFGNTVCVSNIGYYEGMTGIYFPTGGQLSEKFCLENNLLRKLPDGSPGRGYMDPAKRNVTTIKLRGEPSDGLFLPLTCLAFTGIDLMSLKAGDVIDTVNGVEICKKYIPRRNPSRGSGSAKTSKTRKHKEPIAPLFMEHVDTQQLAYNLDAFKEGDDIEITLKLHGTSMRTSYTKVLKGYKRSWIDKLLRREGTPIYDWDYISGTRRVVLDDYEGGFYGSNEFRKQHHDSFVGKLHKGENVYYEVVAYVNETTPIMGKAKVPKEYQKKYGKEMVFSYGCEPGESDIYVYRMTMTNEDGFVVEYSPEFMRYRCEQMGVKTVPVLWRGRVWGENPGLAAKEVAESFYEGPDPIDPRHEREGVVVRIVNRPSFTAYKTKGFLFKLLSGIIVENAEKLGDVSEDILSEL